jgi:hypothetical protein
MKTKAYLVPILAAILTLWATPAAAAEPTPTEIAKMRAAAEAVCPLLEQEAYLVQEIAAEKRNPAGVVDLRKLHELGGLLQFTRAQLRETRAAEAEGLRLFRALAHKPLDLGFCEAHVTQ